MGNVAEVAALANKPHSVSKNMEIYSSKKESKNTHIEVKGTVTFIPGKAFRGFGGAT